MPATRRPGRISVSAAKRPAEDAALTTRPCRPPTRFRSRLSARFHPFSPYPRNPDDDGATKHGRASRSSERRGAKSTRLRRNQVNVQRCGKKKEIRSRGRAASTKSERGERVREDRSPMMQIALQHSSPTTKVVARQEHRIRTRASAHACTHKHINSLWAAAQLGTSIERIACRPLGLQRFQGAASSGTHDSAQGRSPSLSAPGAYTAAVHTIFSPT